MSAEQLLSAIFDGDRSLRGAEKTLFEQHGQTELAELLSRAVQEASQLADRAEAAMRLERLSDLCAQVAGPGTVDALIQILNDDDPRVRVAAGEAIRDVGYERYAEVARGIERALDEPLRGAAMTELPWVLAEIGEPSALPLIRRFLEHPDGEIVAGAIEALVQLGDPDAVEALEALKNDARQVVVDDDAGKATLAELATEAINALSDG